MSPTSLPLQRELSRLGPISPEIDAILNQMYEDLDDPKYDGDPAETLERVAKMMDDHYFIDKDAPYYQNLNPPGASDFETTIIPDSDTTRQHMLYGCTPSCKLEHDPSFLRVLKETEDDPVKHPDSGVAEVEGKPGRWVRRQLKPAKKTEDRKPNCFGPDGTWVNDPEDEERDRTQTPVQQSNTVTTLQRHDTLTG